MNYNTAYTAIKHKTIIVLSALTIVAACSTAYASDKSADIALDQDGIKVWKVKVANSDMLGFKAQGDVNADTKTIFEIIKDVEHSKEWVPNTRNAKIVSLDDKKGLGTFYFVLDMPFPLTDRDLVVNAKYTFEPNGNIRIKNEGIELASIPPKDGIIRITKYYGNWYLEKKSADVTRVTLDGHANPEGGIPSWVANMFVTQQPFDMMANLRKQAAKRIKTNSNENDMITE